MPHCRRATVLGWVRFPSKVGGCFVAGTLVHTDKGLVPIEKLQIGDRVLSQPESTGEKAYKKVVNTFVYDDKPIFVIKFGTGEFPLTIHQCYVTDNHLFWVEGIGWTAAANLRVGMRVQLADGRRAEVLLKWPVWKTPEAGFGWVAASLTNPEDTAHIIDFRSGSNLSQYLMSEEARLSVRFIDSDLDYLGEMEPILESSDPTFKTRVYNIEVEDFHTYYIGELGVWVHNANLRKLCGIT